MSLVQAGIRYARTQVRAPARAGPRRTPEPTTGLFSLLGESQLHLAQIIHDHNQQLAPGSLISDGEVGTAFLQQATDRFLERVCAIFCLQELVDQSQPIQELGSLSTRSSREGYELQEQFQHYNSHLHRRYGATLFSPGHICDAVRVPNGALVDLLSVLRQFSWSTGDSDILGRIHSFLLGRKLVVQAGVICVEDDPLARKSGGVYYTPGHIVRYMVDRTLGRWLYATDDGQPDGEPIPGASAKGLADVRRNGQRGALRVLDPAMGPGTFLRYVLKVLADFYASADPTGTPLDHTKHIIHEHLYGVDVDAGAVALAEVNLLLDVLARTNGAPDSVPIATANLRVGNSLISASSENQRLSAFAARRRRLVTLRQQLVDSTGDHSSIQAAARTLAAERDQLDSALNESLRDRPERTETWQPFNWQIEFPEVFDPDLPQQEQGFTVVIGNPPYVFGEHIPEDEKPYLESHYGLARGQYDLYWLFYERSIDLLKEGGHHSFVVPDALTVRDEAKGVREMLVNRGQLKDIASTGAAFSDPEVSTIVTVWQKSMGKSPVVNVDYIDGTGVSSVDRLGMQTLAVPPRYRFSILVPRSLQAVFAKMEHRSVQLSELVSISRGEELGKRGLHELEDGIREGHIPILVGEDVGSYGPCRPRHSIAEYRVRKERALYGQTKIVVVKTGWNLKATLDTNGFCTLQSLYNLAPHRSNFDLRSLLAIMLSSPVQVYLWRTSTGYKSVFPQITQSQLGRLPIPWLETSTAEVNPAYEALGQLAQHMLDLSKTHCEVLRAVADTLCTGSHTSCSLRNYIDQHDGVIICQPLVDSRYERDVGDIIIEERAESILVRVRTIAPEGAEPKLPGIGCGHEWRDVARLTAVDPELHLYILVALKQYLARKRRKRVWSRGEVLDGALRALWLPQSPVAAVPEVLAGVRTVLPAGLPHHGVGLDQEGAPLHLTSIEDDLHATRSEIDRRVYNLFELSTDEQELVDTSRRVNI